MDNTKHREEGDFTFLTKPAGELPKPITPPLPEVYQIEVTATCNYACVQCPRQFFQRADKTPFIDVDLVKKIIMQGDLDASYFVELQISGEPLLHPDLNKIVRMVKETGVAVGLSTNGVFIRKQMEALLQLDVITVSVDSITHHDDIRKTKADALHYDTKLLIHDIKKLLVAAEQSGTAVDLQIIELDGWEAALAEVQEEFAGYKCNIRTNPNCYHAFIHKDIPLPVSAELCINPWFSASIMANGNVGPCCISHGDDVIYGNLWHQTLREVWAGEPVKKFREQHMTRDYPDVCAKCYMRSPALFHFNMYMSEIKNKYKNHTIKN